MLSACSLLVLRMTCLALEPSSPSSTLLFFECVVEEHYAQHKASRRGRPHDTHAIHMRFGLLSCQPQNSCFSKQSPSNPPPALPPRLIPPHTSQLCPTCEVRVALSAAAKTKLGQKQLRLRAQGAGRRWPLRPVWYGMGVHGHRFIDVQLRPINQTPKRWWRMHLQVRWKL